jgi:hypothetical protein
MDMFFIQRKSIWSLCIIILCIPISGSKNAQNDIPEKSKEPSVEEIEDEQLEILERNIAHILVNTAETKDLILSEEAIDVMTQEVIIWKSYEKIPLSNISLTNSESNQFVGAIADKAIVGMEVAGDLAFLAIADKKVSLAAELFENKIPRFAEHAGVKISTEANHSLESDLLDLTRLNAESWLPIQEINSRNIDYIQTVFTTFPSVFIDENNYQQIKYNIFTKYIELSIYSVPNGAFVDMNGKQIGQTPILDIPLPSDKTYTFYFKLRGYKNFKIKYFADPREEKQKLRAPLIKK